MHTVPKAVNRYSKPTHLVISHRGKPFYDFENSVLSLKHQLQCPWVDGVEFDVQLSLNGVPVVFHDEYTDRIFPGARQRIQDTDYERLVNPIPSLNRVLSGIAELGVKKILNIELKTYSPSVGHMFKLFSETMNLVSKYGLENQVFLSSFEDCSGLPVCQIGDKGEKDAAIQDFRDWRPEGPAFGYYTLGKGRRLTDLEKCIMRDCTKRLLLITDNPKLVHELNCKLTTE